MREKSFVESFSRHRLGMLGFAGVMIVVAVGLCAPLLTPYQKGYGDAQPLAAPAGTHLLGTDGLGLDLFAEIVWGARTSLLISGTAVLVAMLIGIPLGLVSGYFRGKIGALIDSVIEIAMTIPTLPLMILISAIAGASVRTVAVVIGIFAWPTLARITRNSTLKVSHGRANAGHPVQACAPEHRRPGPGRPDHHHGHGRADRILPLLPGPGRSECLVVGTGAAERLPGRAPFPGLVAGGFSLAGHHALRHFIQPARNRHQRDLEPEGEGVKPCSI
jgi:hypothetical protein